MSTISIQRTVWTLAPLVIALALAMDTYVPAIPEMTTVLHASSQTMQLTLSLFMLAAGIMQLFIGPLSDQYGRRRINFLSLAVFFIGSLLCATSQSSSQLILYRIIQAGGSIGMLVTAFAIVRDRYHGEASAKTYSYLNGIIAFSPLFAPFIGSYLDVHFGWQATFLVLLVVAFIGFVSVYYFIPESLAIDKRLPISMKLFHEYKGILLNLLFLYYTFATAIGLCYFFIFCSI